MLFLLFLSVILIIVYSYLSIRRPKKYPPGPNWLPFVGNSPLIKKLSDGLGGLHKAVEKLNEDYKTNILGLKLGKENVVVISTYPLLKEILWKEEFEGRPDNFFIKLRCLGKQRGITMTDGHFSRIQRKFVKLHLRDFGFGKEYMERLIQDEFVDIAELIEQHKSDGIEFSKLIPLSVINVLWNISFGTKMSRNDQKMMTLLTLMNKRTQLFDVTGGIMCQLPWLRYIAPEKSGYNMIKRLNKDLQDLVLETIGEHKRNWSPGRSDNLIYAFLSKMKEEENDKDTTFTDEDQLAMICLDLLIAGAVSTSTTIDCAFMMMILHPDVQAKVQEQLKKAFNKNEEINYSARNKVPYVEAVLNEVQRFCSVGPMGGPRRATADVEVEGYVIPKDTTILFNIHSSHSDKEYWKDPEIFRPSRFLTDDGKLLNHNRYMPFAIGVRRCMGEVLAKSFVFTVFSETIRKYNISNFPGSPAPTGKIISGFFNGPENYKALMTNRS